MSLRVRPVRDADYDALYALHVAAMREPVTATWGWDDDAQAHFFREDWDRRRGPGSPTRGVHHVLCDDDEIVATWLIDQRASEVYLAFIEVAPSHQSRGIATGIIERMLREQRAADRPATLTVLKVNVRARALYERLGFVIEKETATHFAMVANL